jgi:hypothetical protein
MIFYHLIVERYCSHTTFIISGIDPILTHSPSYFYLLRKILYFAMSTHTGPHLWLRAEVKPMEHRAALTPSVCAELKKNGKWCN